jgi:hypothetical protein
VIENRFPREIFGPNRRLEKTAVMRSFITCNALPNIIREIK